MLGRKAGLRQKSDNPNLRSWGTRIAKTKQRQHNKSIRKKKQEMENNWMSNAEAEKKITGKNANLVKTPARFG